MMKNLDIAVLLDFYGDMLTDKQREVIDFYYNEDLSLSEIGEFEGITRQGVRDSIKRGESVLLEMEERLGQAKRFHTVQNALQKIVRCAQDISYYNDEFGYSPKIAEKVNEIIRLAKELDE
ncbi:MAG: DNA-binding protein [Oscillospiraceae bacterium]|nr:DNA-binding protein [Oscillospiraceae bacterium]